MSRGVVQTRIGQMLLYLRLDRQTVISTGFASYLLARVSCLQTLPQRVQALACPGSRLGIQSGGRALALRRRQAASCADHGLQASWHQPTFRV